MMKIGVIGAGGWGKNLVRNFHELGVLAAIAETHPTHSLQMKTLYPEVAVYTDYRELLRSDVSAIAIATPVPTHFEIARDVLLAGKDVLVEKPLTLATVQAEELVQLAERMNCIFMVGHLLLFQPAIRVIKETIDSGMIGDIHSLHQERLSLGKARAVENALWSLGVHDVAVLLYLAGERPTRIEVAGQRALQATIEDDVYLHLDFAGRFKAHLHSSWLWPEKRRSLTVVGSKAMLVFDELAQKVTLHQKTIGADLQSVDLGSTLLYQGSSEPLRLELEHFLACIEERKGPLACGKSAVSVVRVLEEASRQLERQASECGV